MSKLTIAAVGIVIVAAGCGSSPHRTAADVRECATVLQDSTGGLRTAESSLAAHDDAAVKVDFEAIAQSIRSDLSTAPDDAVRRALLAWAADYDTAARVGPTTSAGTTVIGQGAKAAGKLCGK